MTEKIKLVEIKEIPLFIKEGIKMTNDTFNNSSLGLALRFQYQDKAKDVVALSVYCSIKNVETKEEIATMGTLLIFEYQGWSKLSHNEVDIRKDMNIMNVAQYLIGINSGLFYKNMLKKMPEKTPIVPYFEALELLPNMVIQKIE